MSKWIDLEAKYYMKTFRRLPVVLVRGEGPRVWDEDGKCYLDMVAGLAVNILGHAHPAVVEAITSQARKLIHTTNLYYTIPQLEAAELLIEHSCADRVFFGNSGAEANEGAIKLARKYGSLHRHGAYEVISVENSFHGRTLTTLAATGQRKFQDPFAPMPEGFKIVPFNDLAALQQATSEKTCAVMLEVVQGESGVHLADGEYLRDVRRWCDEQNLLLIFDEIQTGMGRTGKFLAYEHYGVEPDVFTLAKGLAGGVPIGAVLAKESAAVFGPGDHGSTFGGNPLATAASAATLRTLFAEDLPARAARVGAYLLQALKRLEAKYPCLENARGLGLMAAVDFKSDVAGKAVQEALAKGLILNNTSARTIRMLPPLIISEAEVDEAISILEAIIPAIAS